MNGMEKPSLGNAQLFKLVKSVQTASAHEPYIDGLRAVAVLLVVLFHLDVQLVSGGFIGVDVFFVISGFLITRNIISRLNEGSFSITEFYAGRIRRLLPALMATILMTIVAAGIFLPPMHLEKFGLSSLYALFHLSNVHFYQSAGYFDTSSELKPLLHLWSLSVEEQFYLFWPIILLFTSRLFSRLWIPLMIAGLSLMSFVAAEYFIDLDPDAVFYLTIFRCYEFGIGALIVFARRWKFANDTISVFLFACAFLLLLHQSISINKFDPFPGKMVLLTALASGVMLWLHYPVWLGKKLLESRLATFIGRISYSLYLTHWPIIVLTKHAVLGPLTPTLQIGLLLASIGSAFLLHSLIENPFRYQTKKYSKTTSKVVTVTASLILFFGISLVTHMHSSQGWPWRYSDEIQNLIVDVKSQRNRNSAEVRRWSKLPFLPDKTAVLIIGDSHATDLFNALHLTNDAISVRRAGISVICQPVLATRTHLTEKAASKCRRIMKKILDGRKSLIQEADIVILAARWKDWAVDHLPDTIEAIGDTTNARIVIAGPSIEFTPEVPDLVAQYGKLSGLAKFAHDLETPSKRVLNQKMKQLAAKLNIGYIDKIRLLCGVESCPLYLQTNPKDDPIPLFIDYGHWTMDAARKVGESIWTDHETARIFKIE